VPGAPASFTAGPIELLFMATTLVGGAVTHIVQLGCWQYPGWGTRRGRQSLTVTVAVQSSHLRVVEASVPAAVATVVMVGVALHSGHDMAATVPLGLAAAASLIARRRYPGWTLLICVGLVVALFYVDPTAGSVAVVAPAVALYSLGVRRGRNQQILGAIVAVAAVIGGDIAHPGKTTVGQTLLHVLLVAIPLLAAHVIRTHHANVALLHERLESAERAREQEAERRVEQERMRIARDLHDVVAHTLTELNVQAGAAAERLEPGETRETLERIEDASHAAIGELRAVLGVLRGPDAARASLEPSPGIDDIQVLVERSRANGLNVRFQPSGHRPHRVSDATSLAAYRIVQESLTNARRHAKGALVTVRVHYNPTTLSLAIENGPSSAVNGHPSPPGVGIIGMTERANSIGGRLVAAPTNSGFRVHATLPFYPGS
jgi:signal transduction histidine kinase